MLYWLDIYQGGLHRYDPDTRDHVVTSLGLVTSAMGVRASGGFVFPGCRVNVTARDSSSITRFAVKRTLTSELASECRQGDCQKLWHPFRKVAARRRLQEKR